MRQTEYRRLTRALDDQLLDELTTATQAELNWLFRQMQYKIRRINQFRPRVGSERPKLQKAYVVSGDLWAMFVKRMHSMLMRLLMVGVIRLKDLNRRRFGVPIEFSSEEFALMIEPQVGKRITHVSNSIKRDVGRKVVAWYNSPGTTMQSLVDQLKDRFGETRARAIAQNEVTFLNSEVTRRIGEQIGATDWWWSTRNDNVVCKKPLIGPDGKTYKGCRELHGKTFKMGMRMPPGGSHLICRCGAVIIPPVVRPPERVKEIIEGLMIQKYDPDQPRDKDGKWVDAGGGGSDNNEVIGRTVYLNLPIQRITDASHLMEYGAVIVGEKGGGEVYAARDVALDHRVLIDAVRAYKKLSPEYEMNEDDFVRFTVRRNYSTDNKQLFVSTASAGIGWSFINDWEERALKNIYKALDRLISLGLPKETEVYIHRDYGKPIRTTAKLDSPGDLTKWDESQHPRDDEGQWTVKGRAGVTREIPQFKIKLRDWGGAADANREGVIAVNTTWWKGMKPDTKQNTITHEIIHQTIEEDMLNEYSKDPGYMDEVAGLLRHGEVDSAGHQWFLGGQIKLNESVAETLSARINDTAMPFVTDEIWDWADKTIERFGYTKEGIKARAEEMVEEIDSQTGYVHVKSEREMEGERIWNWTDTRGAAKIKPIEEVREDTRLGEISDGKYTEWIVDSIDKQNAPEHMQRAGTMFIRDDSTGEVYQSGYWMDYPEDFSGKEFDRYTKLPKSARAQEEIVRQNGYGIKKDFEFNKERNSSLTKSDYVESEHPRNKDGEWTDKGGGVSGGKELSREDFGVPEENIGVNGNKLAYSVGHALADRWEVDPETVDEILKEERMNDVPEGMGKKWLLGHYLTLWNGSSGGTVAGIMISAGMKAAGIDSEVPMSEGEKKYFAEHPKQLEAFKEAGRLIYEDTQKWFKDRGIESVHLYRKGTGHEAKQPFTSWSTTYGGFYSTDMSRINLEEDFPVSQIFSIPPTGFGNIMEDEVVVMRAGGKKGLSRENVRDVFSTHASDQYEIKASDAGGGWTTIEFHNKSSKYIEATVNIKFDNDGDMFLNNVYIPESMRGKGYLTSVLKDIRELDGVSGVARVDVAVNVPGWEKILSRAGFAKQPYDKKPQPPAESQQAGVESQGEGSNEGKDNKKLIERSNVRVPANKIPAKVYVGVHSDWYNGFKGQKGTAIKDGGLDPSIKSNFTHEYNRRDSVYVSTDYSIANAYASLYSSPLVLEIDTSMLDKSKFYYDPLDVGDIDNPIQIAYRGKISPAAIKGDTHWITVTRDLEKWEESKHPRRGKGKDGGQFAPKGQGGGGEPVKAQTKLTPPRTRNTVYGQQVSYAAPNPSVDNLPEVIEWRKKHYANAYEKIVNFAMKSGVDALKFNNILNEASDNMDNGMSPQDAYKEFSKAAHKIMDGKVDAADYLRMENAIRVADWRFIKNLKAGEKPKPEPQKPEAWKPHAISKEENYAERHAIYDEYMDVRPGITNEQVRQFRLRDSAYVSAVLTKVGRTGVSVYDYINGYIDSGWLPRDESRPYMLISEDGAEKNVGNSMEMANYLDTIMNRGNFKRNYDIEEIKPKPEPSKPQHKEGELTGEQAVKKIISIANKEESDELNKLGAEVDKLKIEYTNIKFGERGDNEAWGRLQNAKTAYTLKYREFKKQQNEAVEKLLKADKPATFRLDGLNYISDKDLANRIKVGVSQVKNVLSDGVSLKNSFVSFRESDERSCFKSGVNRVETQSSDSRDIVVPHELGHWLEYNNRGVRMAVNRFLKKRTEGEVPIQIKSLRGKSYYDADEYAKPDKFFDVYCGKIYNDGSTEILSMGIQEYILRPVEFAKKDKEYFALIYDILHGAYEQ